MSIPVEFYYTLSQTKPAYSHTPTDVLDVNKLIQSKAPWIVPSSFVRQPKKLILSDWTAEHWSYHKITVVQEALLQLMEQGFSIYIQQLGQVYPLSRDDVMNLDRKDVRSDIRMTHPKDLIIKAAMRHRMSKDETFILDDYWVDRLIGSKELNAPRTLNLSDYMRLNEEDRLILKGSLEQLNPPLNVLVEDILPEESTLKLDRFKKAFPGINDIKCLKVINPTPAAYTQERWLELLSNASSLEQLHFHSPESTINPADFDLKNLIYLSVEKNIKQLDGFIIAAPNLKGLSIRWMETKSALNTQGVQLESLKILLGRISLKQVFQLLKEQAQSIQQFFFINSTIRDVGAMDGYNLLDIPQCFNMREMDFMNTALTTEELNSFLSITPNLKKLTLGDQTYRKNHGSFELDKINKDLLSQLEYLCLSGLIWDESVSVFLSNKLTNLKCLHLNDFNFVNLPEQNALCLEQIEELIISESFFAKEENLKRLLQYFPNLKRLGFIKNTATGRLDLVYDVSSCKKLEAVDLSDVNGTINHESVWQIVETATNLKALSLIYCINISSAFSEKVSRQYPDLDVYFRWDYEDEDEDDYDSDHQQCSDDEPGLEYNLADYKDFEPTPEDFKFQFKGKSSSIDQNMIIEKLSQYFSLNQINTQYIPKIQDGICTALSHLFQRSTLEEWNDLIIRLQTWDGQLSTISDELKNDFKKLWEVIQQYQLSMKSNVQYIGDSLEHFLISNSVNDTIFGSRLQLNDDDIDDWISSVLFSGLEDDPIQNPLKIKLQQGCILSNFWHTLCIRLIEDGQWLIYNPNYKEGVKSVSTTELMHHIHTDLGHLIRIKMDEDVIVPEIRDPNQFIQNGGLFHLIYGSSSKQLLDLIPENFQFSVDALQGVLLKDLQGIPAWFRGINIPHTVQLTCNLLAQLRSVCANDYSAMLKKSMKRLTPEQKQQGINTLLRSGPKYHSSFFEIMGCPAPSQPSEETSTLIDALRSSSDSNYFEQVLKTWHKPSKSVDTLEGYCKQVLHPTDNKKHLIELDSTASVHALRLALQRQCHLNNRPVYYIHSPDDLICSASFIQRDLNNRGTLRKGPGGPLHDFLTEDYRLESPVLLVNYEHFSAEEIVRFNALLDEQGYADGTPVPEHVQIIGLYNTSKPDCYQGDDFYSRFNTKERCPIPAKQLEQSVPPLATAIDEEAAEGVVINLFNASDWKERLLGRWDLDGSHLTFQEGALSNLQGRLITIQNGPWDDEDFNLFWMEAGYPGTRYFPGSSIPVPALIQLNKQEGYALNELKKWLQVDYLSDEDTSENEVPHVLNPHRLAHYFHFYRPEASDRSLRKEPGLIEQAQHSTLDVMLTRSISLDDWARILTECQKHQVKLRVQCAQGASLPDSLELNTVVNPVERTNWHQALPYPTEVIHSTDSDVTLTLLAASQQNWHIIDVSELMVSDLLTRLDGRLNEAALQFEFHQRSSWLLDALSEGKNIVLKGHFSKELEDQLASLIVQRKKTGIEPGRLLLITEDLKSFQWVETQVHEVSEQDKRVCLGEFPHELEPFIATEPLCKLKARTRYWQAFPDCHKRHAAWSGLSQHTAQIKPLAALNPMTAMQEAEESTQARIALVHQMLDVAPYVFLSGLSGVGKTTFVTQELVHEGEQLHQGIDAIKSWAQDARTGRKYLFLDEATLNSGNWSLFEGLFHTPSGIFYEGAYYPLSDEHKVIFAGNPVSYGDERRLATLFERHGNAVEFEPLPVAVLFEKILKPALEHQFLDDAEVVQLSGVILDVYRFMVDCSTTDVLITPRELQMMALLTQSYCQKNPQANRLDVAAHYAFKIAINLVPKSKR
ncbi:hypothetical protein ELY21_09825, partial [Legionella sp. km535]|uniref:hypothetical protein n=1 Tax=Legionella sp. km535 TaxID=2498107 RepID=UPI000F954E4A